MTIRPIKFTPEVLLGAPRRSAAVPNASGTLAVYTQTTYSFESHSKTNEIRVLEIATGRSALVSNDGNASSPQWLGDSDELVWLSEKSNGNTSFVVGHAREPDKTYTAGTVPGPVSDLKVTAAIELEPPPTTTTTTTTTTATSAGGRAGMRAMTAPATATATATGFGFAVVGKANPDGSLYNPHDAKPGLSSGRLYTSLFVRHWDAYVEPQKNAIWYGTIQRVSRSVAQQQEKEGKYAISGITNLMAVSGLAGVESPIPPFGGADDFDISPSAIVFVAKDPTLDPATHTACVCYYCPMFSWKSLDSQPVQPYRVKGLEGAMSSPVLTSDGGSLAVLAMKKDGYESDKNRILYVPNPWDGEMIEIFQTRDGEGQWELSPSSISFAADDKSLLVTVEEKGRGVLYRLPIDGEPRSITPAALRKLTFSGYVSSVAPASAKSSKLFVSSSSLVDNSTYTIVDPATPGEAQLVSSNSRGGAAFGLSEAQIDETWFAGANNHPVHAWVVKPSNFKPGERYPLAYLIHGGPQGAWNDQWSVRWNPAVFAEQGYVVVTPNPTGSTGYGQAFTDAIQGSWGGLPYEDICKGFEHIAANLAYIDTSRAVALGASYGGYMINWIQGHELGRRFKALVTHDGVFSMTSQLASEEQYFPLHDLQGPLWKNADGWAKWDPSRFTADWATPHLIIHNELDYRLTIAEGLAAFNVLQMKGIDSAFLTFPDENHWVLKPENSLVWHRTVLNWINKHVGLPSLDSRSKPRQVFAKKETAPAAGIASLTVS